MHFYVFHPGNNSELKHFCSILSSLFLPKFEFQEIAEGWPLVQSLPKNQFLFCVTNTSLEKRRL